MAEKKTKDERFTCPVGSFFAELEDTFGRHRPFFKHLTRSKIEFLKGIKSLLDDRINYYEKKDSKRTGAKLTKVKVE